MIPILKPRCFVLLFVAFAVAQSPSVAQETCPAAPANNSSDTTFGYQPNCGNLCITRVVGPGDPSEFASDGTLNDWNTYVANNVVARTAYMRLGFGMPTDGLDPGPNTHISFTAEILVNGNRVGSATISRFAPHGSGTFCWPVSTRYLKFAHHAALGQTPSPQNALAGANNVEVNVSSAVCTYPGIQGLIVQNPCIVFAGPLSVTFDALAPVIMVHGIGVPATGENSDWFVDFAEPFQLQKLSFAKLLFSGDQPIEFGSSTLPAMVFAAANQFGANHVHIVAHSKGGLWTREFLTRGLPTNFGVYSVHTLDTPHHGSVGADIAFAAHQGARVGFLFGFGTKLLPMGTLLDIILYNRDAQNDLRVSTVARYNNHNQHLLPPTTTAGAAKNVVQYFAYTGDANQGGPTDGQGFGVIDCSRDPCDGYFPWTPIPQMLYKSIQRWQSVHVNFTANGQLFGLTANPNSWPYPGDDFVVTVPSAKYEEDRFTTVYSPGVTTGAATFFVNHHTIGAASIGAVVSKKIIEGLQQQQ